MGCAGSRSAALSTCAPAARGCCGRCRCLPRSGDARRPERGADRRGGAERMRSRHHARAQWDRRLRGRPRRVPPRQDLRRRDLERWHGAARTARRAPGRGARTSCSRKARRRRVPRRHAHRARVRSAGLHRAALPSRRRPAQGARGVRRAPLAGLQRERARPAGGACRRCPGQEPTLVGGTRDRGRRVRIGRTARARTGRAARPLPRRVVHRVLPQRGLRPRDRSPPITTSRTSCRTATAGSSPRSTGSRTRGCTCAPTRTRARASRSRP